MHYETVFDIATAGYKNWWFPMVGALATGVLIVLVRRRIKDNSPKQLQTVFLTLIALCAAIWTIGALAITLGDYYEMKERMAKGRGTVVEGVISGYSRNYKKGERFCVQDTCFQYSNALLTSGFNSTGVVRDGLWVRVTHFDGVIMRLEVDGDRRR